MQTEEYITVSEAAKRAGYSPRQIHRYVNKGVISGVCVNPSLVKISVASLEAFLEKRGERLVDPLKHLKQLVADLQVQVALLRVQIILLQQGQVTGRVRGSGSQSAAEKRGLPADMVRLTHFAEQHGLKDSVMRRLASEDSSLVTLIERPEARVNKRTWWLTAEQQVRIIAVLRAQEIAYTLCASCPHGV